MFSQLNYDINGYELVCLCWSTDISCIYIATKYQKKYLLKFIPMTKENMGRAYAESQLQAEIQHPYITPILEQFDYETYRVVVMPYTFNETLFDLQKFPNLSIHLISIIMYRIAVALSTLHSSNILLRNIQPSNILINDIETEDPKPQILKIRLNYMIMIQLHTRQMP